MTAGLYVSTLDTQTVSITLRGFLSEAQWGSVRSGMSLPSFKVGRDGWRLSVSDLEDFLAVVEGIPVELTASASAILETVKKPAVDPGVGQERLDYFARLGTGMHLYPFQEDAVRWLAPRREALLALDMGCGKTPTMLVALPPDAPVLAVVPAVVLTNWMAEARRWRPDMGVSIVKNRKSFRFPSKQEIVITSPGMMPYDDDPTGADTPHDSLEMPGGMWLLGDELHIYKGKTTRHKAFKNLSRLTHELGGASWGATGTPLQNHPPELWQTLESIGLAIPAFGHWGRFARMFGGEKKKWIPPARGKKGRGRLVISWDGKPTPEVNRCLQKVWLRRTKAEVLPQLPGKRRTDIFLGSLDTATAKACDEAVEALKAAGVSLAADDLLDVIKDPDHVSKLSKARAQLAAAKVAACVEIVEGFEEAEEPIVVASAYVAPCKALGARAGWACITGETPSSERGDIVAAFQAGKLKGLAFTYRAGGVGVTLTRASNMILNDLDWNPAIISQGEDRLVRIGQTRGVLIQRLVADHALDRQVIRLLTKKQRMIDEVERKA